MSQNESFGQVSRRDVLRAGLGGVVGALIGSQVMPPADATITRTAAKVGISNGNANFVEWHKQDCPPTDTLEECADSWKPTLKDRVNIGVVSPVLEEALFRAAPSIVHDTLIEPKSVNLSPTTFVGSGRPYLTRRELATGLVSSLAFAGAHNMSMHGVLTSEVPITPLMTGMAEWTLTRTLGIGSGVAAHMAYNLSVVNR